MGWSPTLLDQGTLSAIVDSGLIGTAGSAKTRLRGSIGRLARGHTRLSLHASASLHRICELAIPGPRIELWASHVGTSGCRRPHVTNASSPPSRSPPLGPHCRRDMPTTPVIPSLGILSAIVTSVWALPAERIHAGSSARAGESHRLEHLGPRQAASDPQHAYSLHRTAWSRACLPLRLPKRRKGRLCRTVRAAQRGHACVPQARHRQIDQGQQRWH
jgi:hypothetical protein